MKEQKRLGQPPRASIVGAMATTAAFARPLVSPAASDRKLYTGIAIMMLFTLCLASRGRTSSA